MRSISALALLPLAVSGVSASPVPDNEGIEARSPQRYRDDGYRYRDHDRDRYRHRGDRPGPIIVSVPQPNYIPVPSYVPNYVPVQPVTIQPVGVSVGYNSGTQGCANGQTYSTPQGDSFQLSCGVDWATGDQAAPGFFGNVADLTSLKKNSLTECLNACSNYNDDHGATVCQAVTFHTNIQYADNTFGGNCWLKDKVGIDKASGEEISARLIGLGGSK